MDALTITATLMRIPLFQGLSSTCLKEIAQGANALFAPKGKKLFFKGDPAENFYYVIDGRVKLAFVSEQGAEKVVEVIHPGMSFGEAVMILNEPYPVYAETLKDSCLVRVRRREFVHALEHDKQMSLRIIASLSRRLHQMTSDMESDRKSVV